MSIFLGETCFTWDFFFQAKHVSREKIPETRHIWHVGPSFLGFFSGETRFAWKKPWEYTCSAAHRVFFFRRTVSHVRFFFSGETRFAGKKSQKLDIFGMSSPLFWGFFWGETRFAWKKSLGIYLCSAAHRVYFQGFFRRNVLHVKKALRIARLVLLGFAGIFSGAKVARLVTRSRVAWPRTSLGPRAKCRTSRMGSAELLAKRLYKTVQDFLHSDEATARWPVLGDPLRALETAMADTIVPQLSLRGLGRPAHKTSFRQVALSFFSLSTYLACNSIELPFWKCLFVVVVVRRGAGGERLPSFVSLALYRE